MDADSRFFSPLWTEFGSDRPGILDGYTVFVAVTAWVVLALHGSRWLQLRTESPVRERSMHLATRLSWGALLAMVVLSAFTFRVQPHVWTRYSENMVLWIFPVLTLVAWGAQWKLGAAGRDGKAFLSSCAFVVGLMGCVAGGLFPYLLPSTLAPEHGIHVYNGAAPEYGLHRALFWWIPALVLVAFYFIVLYRNVQNRITPQLDGGS